MCKHLHYGVVLGVLVAVGVSTAASANPFSDDLGSERLAEMMKRLDRLEMMVEDNTRNLTDELGARDQGTQGEPSQGVGSGSSADSQWANAQPLGQINGEYYVSQTNGMKKVSAETYESILQAHQSNPPQNSSDTAEGEDGASPDDLEVAPEE